jgi:GntR family transcriptional regulator of vanillate catabolism
MDGFLEYIRHNEEYHRELWRLAKSPALERELEHVCALPFAEPGALVFGTQANAAGFHGRNATLAVEQHRAILEAIENREGTRAESVAREHSRLARRDMDWALANRELLQQVPGGPLIVLPGEAETSPRKRGAHREES